MSLHDDLDELADICEHMKPVGQWPGAKAIRALREAAALVRMVEGAPVAVVECNDAKGAWLVTVDDAPLYKGQRVRIVPVEGGKAGP
jgi:phosphoribosylcarboxyaminoimidazole (NCAIR) mutase